MKESASNPATRAALRWMVAVGLLAALVYAVPIGDVTRAFSQAEWRWAGLAVGFFFAAHGAHAVRLRMLLRALGLRWTWREVAHFHFTSLAYALVLPGGAVTGTAVRLYRISNGGRDLGAAGAGLLLDRLVATLTLGVSGVIGAACSRFASNPVILLALIAVSIGAGGALGLALMGAPRLTRIADWMARRGITRAAPLRPTLKACALSLGIHGIGVLAFVCAAHALGISMDFSDMAYARASMIVAAMLPITAAGLGVREGAALFVLGALGVAPERALAFSLMTFLLGWAAPGALGGVVEAIAQVRRAAR